jgi:hypothetical protein
MFNLSVIFGSVSSLSRAAFFSSQTRLTLESSQTSFTVAPVFFNFPKLTLFDSLFSKSLSAVAESRAFSLAGTTYTSAKSFKGNSLTISHCVFKQIASATAAVSFTSHYNPAFATLGKAAVLSSTFWHCSGRLAGALAISRGLVKLNSLCVIRCSSPGKTASAVALSDMTSLGIELSTITESAGSARECCLLHSFDEAFVGSVNYSMNHRNSSGCGGFSLRCPELVEIRHLWVQRAYGSSYLAIECGAGSKIVASAFVSNTATTFATAEKVVFERCGFIETLLDRDDTTATVTFKNCLFSLSKEPLVANCQFIRCQYAVSKPPRLAMLDTALCRGSRSQGAEADRSYTIVLFLLTIIVILALIYFFCKNLRYDVRNLLRISLAALSAVTAVVLFFSVGGFVPFVFIAVAGAAGYLTYVFRDKLGEANAVKIQAFVDTAKSTFGGLAGDIGALKAATVEFEADPTDAANRAPIEPVEFSEL